jgi:hypothetical protein
VYASLDLSVILYTDDTDVISEKDKRTKADGSDLMTKKIDLRNGKGAFGSDDDGELDNDDTDNRCHIPTSPSDYQSKESLKQLGGWVIQCDHAKRGGEEECDSVGRGGELNGRFVMNGRARLGGSRGTSALCGDHRRLNTITAP